MIELTEQTAGIVAERFRALAQPMRLRILDAMRRAPRTVSQLVELTDGGQANVSKHLQILHQQGFVERRRDGTAVYYRIADPLVFDLCDMVCGGLRDNLDEKRRMLRAPR